MNRKAAAAVLMVSVALAVTSGCAYKIYVRGVQEPDAGRIEPDLPMHVMVRADAESPTDRGGLAAKIEKLLTDKGYTVVPEAEAEAYLFFDYDMEDLLQRKYLKPSRGAGTGITTTRSEGPFVHSLAVSVVNAASYLEKGKTEADVLWAGGAVIDTTSLRSPKAIDMLVVALFEHFPENTEGTLETDVRLNDRRAEKLRHEQFE